MKVICIDNKPYGFMPGAASLLKEGEVYTVVMEINSEAYVLLEVEHPHPLGAWDKKRFLPCSDIDETELIEQRQTQYA